MWKVETLSLLFVPPAKGGGMEIIMKKKNDLVWSISLMVIGLATIILAGSNIVGIELPDVAVRIFGIVDLIALPFLAYSTVKKVKKE